MALQHRREAAIRPRFLLALTLSTVTACVVAAPLAIQAINAKGSSYAAGSPAANQPLTGRQTDDLSAAEVAQLSLAAGSEPLSQGGIGAQSRAKGQDTTTKSDLEVADAVAPPTSVLTNDTGPESTTTSAPAATTVPDPPTTAPPTSAEPPATPTTTGTPATTAPATSVTTPTTAPATTTSTSRATSSSAPASSTPSPSTPPADQS